MRYLAVRFGLALPTLLGAVTIVFVLLRVVPGDPATAMLGDLATAENVAHLRRQLGLDRPLGIQYLSYLGEVLTGDLGRSLRSNNLVAGEIFGRLPMTALLAVEGVALSLLFGVPIGLVTAVRRNSAVDAAMRVISMVGISMPAFWFGIILLFVFSVKLDLFPVIAVGGAGGVLDLLHRSVLPAVTVGIINGALVVRLTRSSLLEVYNQDYVRTARAKGLPERAVTYRHALRNALMPVITVTGVNMGRLLGGTVIVETVFSWPGLGKAMIDAMRTRDYPVVQGAILVLAASFIIVNLLVDLVYGYLDPRIRYA